MPVFARALCLSVEAYRVIQIPKHIKINPMEEGDTWWIKWTTLYYNDGNDQYDFGYGDFDGDYKRPKITTEEEDLYEDDDWECESACECEEHNAKRVCDYEVVEPDESVCVGTLETVKNDIVIDTEVVMGDVLADDNAVEHICRMKEIERGK